VTGADPASFNVPAAEHPEREVLIFPTSFAQQRLWFLDQLAPGSPLYNIRERLVFDGPLDVSALELALNALVARHEALRTTFSG
jgi:hypothetical protein